MKRTLIALTLAGAFAAPAIHSTVQMASYTTCGRNCSPVADIGVCRGCRVIHVAEVDWLGRHAPVK